MEIPNYYSSCLHEQWFKIDLIVWKYEYGSFIDEENLKFKIDLIVWKLKSPASLNLINLMV